MKALSRNQFYSSKDLIQNRACLHAEPLKTDYLFKPYSIKNCEIFFLAVGPIHEQRVSQSDTKYYCARVYVACLTTKYRILKTIEEV